MELLAASVFKTLRDIFEFFRKAYFREHTWAAACVLFSLKLT